MKLVILAAGRGKRMGDSSNHTPKPILEYMGKTLIEHKLNELLPVFTEIIIVVGHLKDKIIDKIGLIHTNSVGTQVPITYVEQSELLGTGHALHQAKDIIGSSPFLVLMGDDLYSKTDISQMIEHYESTKEWSVLLEKSPNHIPYGKCIVDENGYIREIVNDTENKIEQNNMYTGACLLTPDFFNIPLVLVSSTEYGLPQTFISVAKERNIKAFYTKNWKRITTPEDLKG